jgi:uncharacterized protein DUF3105
LDRRGLLSRAALAAAALAGAAALLAGCGGGGSGGGSADTKTETTASGVVIPPPQPDDQHRAPVGSSVGDGLDGAPGIEASVTAAAKAAGCRAASFPSDGANHVVGNPDYSHAHSLPPTSGPHYPIWANWGYYTSEVPYRNLVHNLEHGGIEVYVGSKVPIAAQNGIAAMWARSPAYMVIVPASPDVPANSVVVTSWQRWLVCKPYRAAQLTAVEAFRDAYRGRGREAIAGVNAPANAGTRPKPQYPDPGAEKG